jgi:Na+/H+-translocating membrane pyrophosphatase
MDSTGQWSIRGNSSVSNSTGTQSTSSGGIALPPGAIAGIAVGGTAVLLLVIVILLYFMYQPFRDWVNLHFSKTKSDG